jgi:hypothetical protein
MPWDQLVSELADERNYVLTIQSQEYQVDVTLLENTDDHVLAVVSVDDGSFWAACNPLSECFRIEKHPTPPQPRR